MRVARHPHLALHQMEVFLHALCLTAEIFGDEKSYCYLSLDLDFIFIHANILILYALDFLNINSHGFERKMVVLFCSGDYQKLILFHKKNHYSLHEVLLDYQYKLPDSLLLH